MSDWFGHPSTRRRQTPSGAWEYEDPQQHSLAIRCVLKGFRIWEADDLIEQLALETRLKRMVCDGKLTLAEAQKAIATNWIAAYKKYVDKEGCPELDEP